MNAIKYRIFVCGKKRATPSEKCCWHAGSLAIYQAFQAEISRLNLSDRVEVYQSGCLDCCAAGVVAMVYQPNRGEFSWLPTKLRVKLRKFLFPQRFVYGNLTVEDVKAIAEQHLLRGKAVSQCQVNPVSHRSKL